MRAFSYAVIIMKAIIIGCPGSGKSTFARKLHVKTSAPLHHLDMLWLNSDKTTVSADVFDAKLQEIISDENWIIDGNYASTMEMRFEECDTVFFLDYPLEVCLDGIESRKGQPRSDMPWVEKETDEEFVEYVKTFNENHGHKITELIEKYQDREIIIFHSRKEAEEYLSALKINESESRYE